MNNLHQQITERIQTIHSKIPHTLNQEQIKLVELIAKEIILSITDDITAEAKGDTEAQKKLETIQKLWKEFNNILQ